MVDQVSRRVRRDRPQRTTLPHPYVGLEGGTKARAHDVAAADGKDRRMGGGLARCRGWFVDVRHRAHGRRVPRLRPLYARSRWEGRDASSHREHRRSAHGRSHVRHRHAGPTHGSGMALDRSLVRARRSIVSRADRPARSPKVRPMMIEGLLARSPRRRAPSPTLHAPWTNPSRARPPSSAHAHRVPSCGGTARAA